MGDQAPERARVRIGRADQHRLKVDLQLGGRRVTFGRVDGQRPRADRVEHRRATDVGRQSGHRDPGREVVNDVGLGHPVPEAALRQQLPQHDADGEHIGAAVDGLAAEVLGRHVDELALERAGPRAMRGRRRLGDAEVHQLHLAVVGHEHVVRADVAVNDAQRVAGVIGQLVRVVQAGQGVDENAKAQREAELARSHAVQHGRQRLAVEVLHRDRQVGSLLDHLVGLNHVRMIEADRQPRLVVKHRHEVGIGGEVGPDSLQDDDLADAAAGVHQRQQHFGHAAAADRRHQMKSGGRLARCQTRHGPESRPIDPMSSENRV